MPCGYFSIARLIVTQNSTVAGTNLTDRAAVRAPLFSCVPRGVGKETQIPQSMRRNQPHGQMAGRADGRSHEIALRPIDCANDRSDGSVRGKTFPHVRTFGEKKTTKIKQKNESRNNTHNNNGDNNNKQHQHQHQRHRPKRQQLPPQHQHHRRYQQQPPRVGGSGGIRTVSLP